MVHVRFLLYIDSRACDIGGDGVLKSELVPISFEMHAIIDSPNHFLELKYYIRLFMTRVLVAGVGMTRFVRPGGDADYPEFASLAVRRALADANISYNSIQQVFCGYVYGDSTSGLSIFSKCLKHVVRLTKVFVSIIKKSI